MLCLFSPLGLAVSVSVLTSGGNCLGFASGKFHCNDVNDCGLSLSTEMPRFCYGCLCSNINIVYLFLDALVSL